MKKINPILLDVIKKVSIMVGSSLLLAISGFLSKVLEPMVAWFSFASMRLLIKLTKSKGLRSLYAEMREGYYKEKER